MAEQLTLGEIIDRLEAVADKERKVAFDFEYLWPTTLASWRGDYSQLALGFNGTIGHSLKSDNPTIAALLQELRSAIGKGFEGWKGGEYVMDSSTLVWVANPGNVGNTAIVGVSDRGYRVVLDTAWCEY